MRNLPLCCLLFASLPVVHGGVSRSEGKWELENEHLKVTVVEENAHLTVEDKASGTVWTQEAAEKRAADKDDVRARRAKAKITVDGNPEEWRGVPHEEYVWLPWMGDNGEANCSGGAKVMWDDETLYLYVRVRDDNVAFGGEATAQWWEADSVEFWVDSVQVGLHLAPAGKEVAVNSRGEAYEGAKVGLRMIHEERLPGYELEIAMPLRHFPVLRDPVPGVRFSFALGLNDADPKPGEPVKRDRQSYTPRSWVHSAPATFATAVLTDADGMAPPRNKENDRSAMAGGGRVSDMKPGQAPDSLVYSYVLQRGQAKEVPLLVTLRLLSEQAALDVELECPAGAETPLRAFNYPYALYPTAPETYFVGVANYTNGRYLPVGDSFCRNQQFCMAGGDLPFLLVTDGEKGLATILLTPWDGAVQMQTRNDDPEKLGFPGFRWHPAKGLWGSTRQGRLAFFAKGGHVTACRIYRELAKQQGLVRTFAEKAKVKPNVRKLFGAVNWWGGNATFAREAIAAGMKHGLLNGRPSPQDMAEIAAKGWLVGEYDNYEDINDSETIARAKAPVKEHAVVKADGEFMTAWVTRDKDMNPIHTYMKQCTAVMTKCARIVIPDVLKTYPYNTRFLDVTTATGLKECYSPIHPLDRRQDQACREELCAYVGDELGLVAGGEHGRYYDVRYLDYHEGMMGGGAYSWPAGYLRDVKTREEVSERYLKYGINPAFRVPMFELVFHDCVVNYWYWGATNDYLHQVAPEITDRKTAMNVLYGTPPMMWANSHGLRWGVPEERQMMIDIYRQTCKLHEVVADQEMLSHEYLTPDRMLQRSTFADGTVCTVNFGEAAHVVAAGGREFRLGTNDFYVKGPQIEQWRTRTGGANDEREVYIRTADFLLAEQPDGELRQAGIAATGKVCIQRNGTGATIQLQPGAVLDLDLDAWAAGRKSRPSALFLLDQTGRTVARGPRTDDNRVRLEGGDAGGQWALLLGEAADRPDVVLSELALSVRNAPVTADQVLPGSATLEIEATVRNTGLAPAKSVTLTIRLDGPEGQVLLEERLRTMNPGAHMVFRTSLSTSLADGQRRIVAALTGDGITQTGPQELAKRFVATTDPAAFPIRQPLAVTIPAGDTGGLPVELPFALPATADPANLRVLFADGVAVPAQFEATAAGGREGVLVFALPSGLAPGEAAAELLATTAGSSSARPPASGFTVVADGSRLVFGTYSLRLLNGVLSDIAVARPDGKSLTLVSAIIESSEKTGWSTEEGEITDFALEHNGPVRAVFRLAKTLKGDFKLTRRFLFYADRFEVQSACTPGRGLLTRAMYAVDGTAANGSGAQVKMDGVGNNEDFGFKGNPQWFAVYGPDYRSACFALTPAAGFTYWDNGANRGQIGLGNPGGTERRVYVWRADGADSPDYAEQLWQAYSASVRK